jgi:hypothetical protein
MIGDLMDKLEKSEVLRHYRIANFDNEEEMLKAIANKKGLVDK